MKINLQKTRVKVFRNGGLLRDYVKWYFNGNPIESVSAYMYMGLFIIPTLIWLYAKRSLASQARRSIISMIKLQSSDGCFDYTETFKLFDTMINQFYFMDPKSRGLNSLTQLKTSKIIFVKDF